MPQLPRGIHRRTFFEVSESLSNRFWRRTQRNGDAECWPWLGGNRNGYGAIRHNDKIVSAHVVSFLIHGGVLVEGTIITHTCDNRICVNPSHLVAGSPTSNVVEMHQRRLVPAPRGTECYNAVLNDELVREIRRFATEHGCGEVVTARHFGLSRWAVKGVLSGKTWKHVI